MIPSRVVALAGGVGGARLATGLQATLAPGTLTVIVNTGDDFEHWGLTVCPDLDTVLYNLAGVNHPDTGWGRADETFAVLAEMTRRGGEGWFRIGDRDLVTHLLRTQWLRQGLSLTAVTDRLRRDLGIPTTILPMSDAPVRTVVHTDEGDLPFQQYFVRRRCEPRLLGVTFTGSEQARPTPQVVQAIADAEILILCPSNPYVSLDPILSLPGLRAALYASPAPCVAVSPIVGGRALKGPAAKMMQEMGLAVSPLTVAEHFRDLLDGIVIDQADASLAAALPLPTLVTDTIMVDAAAKARLAAATIAFAQRIASP